MLVHSDLAVYYKLMFAMVQHHKYPIVDYEKMLPFERDAFVGMLHDYLEREKARQQKQGK